MSRVAILCAVTSWLASPAFAAQQERSNAAWWYGVAAKRMSVLTAADWNALGMCVRSPGAPPSAAAQAALARAGQILSAVREGSRQETANYGTDSVTGMTANALATTHALQMGWLLQSDAINHLHAGNSQAAADSTAAAFLMARHMGQSMDSTLAVNGAQLFESAGRITSYELEAGTLTPADAGTLHAALDKLEPRDPFNLGVAMVHTANAMLSMFADQHKQGDVASIQKYVDVFDRTQGVRVEGFSDEEFAEQIQKSRELLGRVARVYYGPDRAAAGAGLAALHAEVEAGKYGVLIPWYDNAEAFFAIIGRSEAGLAACRAFLEKAMAGEVAGTESLNAAAWYFRAMTMLEPMRASLAAAIAAQRERDDAASRKELDDKLLAADGIVEVLRDGSRIDRCDFWFGRPQPLAFVPEYVPGMHEALGLLLADARRAIRGNDPVAAAERLAICDRVIAHLASDGHIESSLVAQVAFERTAAVTTLLTDGHVLPGPAARALLESVQRLNPKDPFGLAASIVHARDVLVGPVLSEMKKRDGQADQQTRTAVRSWNGDQVLMIIAVFALGREPGPANVIGETPADVEAAAALERSRRLEGILSADALSTLGAAARSTFQRFRSGDFGFATSEEGVDSLAHVEDHLRAAREKYQTALDTLQKAQTAPPEDPE